MNKKDTIELLKNQGPLTVDMADSFIRGETQIVFSSETAVAILHPCGAYMFWSKDYASAINLLKEHNLKGTCVVHGNEAQTAYKDTYGADFLGKPCIQYCKSDRIPFIVPDVCHIRPLNENDTDFVLLHYDMTDSPEYIASRIAQNELYGAEINDRLVGFIGSHNDGSIGMLEIIPEFRRRGIATALEYYQMNRHISMGYTPYGQVYYDNDNSLLLQKKIGLDYSTETIAWGHCE